MSADYESGGWLSISVHRFATRQKIKDRSSPFVHSVRGDPLAWLSSWLSTDSRRRSYAPCAGSRSPECHSAEGCDRDRQGPRRLDRHGLNYLKADNVFLRVSDLVRAQRLADRFASVDWVRVLGRYAQRINPLLSGLLAPMRYYSVDVAV